MKKLEIFDPALCCETGVCGTSIDQNLLRIATVVSSLKKKGIVVKRFGLSTTPMEFVLNKVINDTLQKDGADILPVTLLDGKVMKTKEYPTNEELSKWLDVIIDEKASKCCTDKNCCSDNDTSTNSSCCSDNDTSTNSSCCSDGKCC